MFSYTDDAIVTSSPTGRHLSTVIRRPAAIGPLDWNEHAEQVCKVLNELGSKAKLSLHLQAVGRLYRLVPRSWPLEDQIPLTTEPTPATARIAELEKQLDDANARLECSHLVELSDLQLRQAYAMSPGSTMSIESQRVVIKRVE